MTFVHHVVEMDFRVEPRPIDLVGLGGDKSQSFSQAISQEIGSLFQIARRRFSALSFMFAIDSESFWRPTFISERLSRVVRLKQLAFLAFGVLSTNWPDKPCRSPKPLSRPACCSMRRNCRRALKKRSTRLSSAAAKFPLAKKSAESMLRESGSVYARPIGIASS